MTRSARHYVFTLNNPVPEEAQALADFAQTQECSYLIVGRETGDSGTPHLQGYVAFRNRKTLLQAKALVSNRAHLEVMRGTSSQAIAYCKKDGDYDEYGTAPAGRGKGAAWRTLNDYLSTLDSPPSESELLNEFPDLVCQYPEGVQKMIHLKFPPDLQVDSSNLREWQRALEEQLEAPPDDRSVIFCVDYQGGSGKSWFCKYLLSKRDDVQILKVGKRDDLACCIDEFKKIFLFDVPRTGMEYFQYSVCEMLKDQLVFSPKYQSRMKYMRNLVHVVVFSNEYPDTTKLSADRFQIKEITEHDNIIT